MKNKVSLLTGICSALMLSATHTPAACDQGAVTITNLPTLGGSSYEADALNASGQITGFSLLPGDTIGNAFLYTSNGISDVPTLGGNFGQGFAVNNSGQVVGQANTPGDMATHAFLFSSNVTIDLGTLGGGFSAAMAINDSGVIAGNSDTSSGDSEAFVCMNGVMTSLGTLGGTFSLATAVNQSGAIAGDSYTANNAAYHAYLWTNGIMTDLGTLGGSYSSAFALNDSGVVVGESSLSNADVHGFICSNGTMVDVGTFGGTESSAYAVNRSGQVVGYATTANDAETHAFIYQAGGLTDLGTLGGTYSEADAINNQGQVVGYSTTTNGASHAFLWQNGTLRDLNSLLATNSGWELQTAQFINDAGRIVGMGTYNGVSQWYVLDVSTADRSPVAIVGPVQTADCQTPVTLDGSRSNDPDGDALTYQWSEGDVVLGTNSTLTVSLDLGTHTITLTVTDPCGQSAQTNVSVQIADATPPTISSAPAPITVSAGANCEGAVPNVLPNVVAVDNCTAANELVLDQNPAAGTLLGTGQHSIAVTVKDLAGNSTTTNIPLTVADTTAPTITSAPASITLSNCDAVMPNVLSLITASDNCTPADQLVFAQIPAAGTALTHGQYTVSVTVADASGNVTSRNIPLSVADATAPVIQSLTVNPGELSPPNHQLVPITVLATVSDNCDPAPVSKIISITANEGIASGDIEITGDLTAVLAASRNPSGSGRVYTITVRSTDASGNSSTGSVAVSVPKGSGNGNGNGNVKIKPTPKR